MESRKRIALITTWFPPQQSVATNRMLAFTEYLSESFDIEVFCLGPDNESTAWSDHVKVHYSKSNQLFDKIKSSQADSPLKHKFKTGLRIILSKIIKNPLAGWQKKSVEKLVKAHANRAFDLIISSYAPQEAHLVALAFCKQYPTVPWIADMRDEMSKNPGLNEQQKENMMAIESQINMFARAILSVSEPILADFKKLCPKVQFFEEIRNGFNHSFVRSKASGNANSIFTLGYFGTFYGTRKPGVVMEALRQLVVEIPDFDFRWEIFGAHHNFNIPSELSSKVCLHEGLTYMNAIHKMAEMDLNLQLHPRSEQKGVFTGKLFDYISVQKPVLALVDKDDVAAQLIRDFDCGYVAEFSDLEENKKMILQAYNDWKNKMIKFATDDQAQSLHRKNQVYQLKSLINKIVEQ